MRIIVVYLVMFLLAIGIIWGLCLSGQLPDWFPSSSLALKCVLIGGVGGIFYCLRSVYVHWCILKDWDICWTPWYYIRPLVSSIAGGISWLFIQSGLLILNAIQKTDMGIYGFLALSFIVGYNVDRSMARLEKIAESVWGIKASRSSNIDGDKQEE